MVYGDDVPSHIALAHHVSIHKLPPKATQNRRHFHIWIDDDENKGDGDCYTRCSNNLTR